MKFPIQISSSACSIVAPLVQEGQHALETERGWLYVEVFPKGGARGAIVLKVSFNDYYKYIHADEVMEPNVLWIIPCKGYPFQVVVMVPSLEIRDGKTFVEGREVRLI